MLAPDHSDFYAISKGLAQGELIGGNLTVFSQLSGNSLPTRHARKSFYSWKTSTRNLIELIEC